jgi:single-strand DNA-binding protein
MINKAIILGRIGFIETKNHNGMQYTKLSVATNEKWKDKNGEKQEKTIWHNVCGFNKLAEVMARYAKKGDVVYVEGKIAQNKYKDDSGVEKISSSITASEFKILNSTPQEEAVQTNKNSGNVKSSGSLLDDDIPW